MPENTAFLFAAFAVVWIMIFGYCLFIGGKIGGLRVQFLAKDPK